jgi:hypothetical protein
MSPDEGCFPADFSLASRTEMEKVVATGHGCTAAPPRRPFRSFNWTTTSGTRSEWSQTGKVEDGERPELNDEGHRFYVRSTPGWQEGEPFWPDSLGADSVEAAKREAERGVPSPVTWH